ncbi:PAP2 superfamily protein [Planctomycetes bacterium Pla163]|uniref:PAP2 superfamily protein n=1 Tax=Rohdeia mirabilis TaxID=2528008 RepID=A0A518D4W3_9BACT|nr:PAP2 superfamily protein [Planctomycetes bacterium Pla163]
MLVVRRSPARARFLPVLLVALLPSCRDGADAPPVVSASFVKAWNAVAIDASGLDHTPSNEGPAHDFGHQLGPCRASRAMAMTHVAMFEALNAIERRHASYLVLPTMDEPASVEAAIAQAARDTLSALFPSQTHLFDAELADTLATIPAGAVRDRGVVVGQAAALAVLGLRAADGSNHAESHVGVDFFCSDDPGRWRPDPTTGDTLALGAHWGDVDPWLLAAPDQFRAPIPPGIDSPEYALAFAEVRAVGGDGVTTPTVRSDFQTFVGIFWAYDGTPSLCAPPRLYNQIIVQVADQQRTDGYELLRLLAIANVALADTAIACWESKFFHDYWRPVVGIREADPGTGPTGLGDGNPGTAGDPTFTPLGSPASNLAADNFTPPFPTYPSGHASFGGALFETLRRFYGTDELEFTFVSDEYDGTTIGQDGLPRPYVPRTFQRFSDAEIENGQSRVYLGIHWYYDADSGIDQGRQVAGWTWDNLYPVD